MKLIASSLLPYASLATAYVHYYGQSGKPSTLNSTLPSNAAVIEVTSSTSNPARPMETGCDHEIPEKPTTIIPVQPATTLTSTSLGHGYGFPAPPPAPPKVSLTLSSSLASSPTLPPLPPSLPITPSTTIVQSINYGYPPSNVTVPIAPGKSMPTSAPSSSARGYDLPVPRLNSTTVAPVKPVTIPSNASGTGLGYAAPTGHKNSTTMSVAVSSRVTGTAIVPTKSVSPLPVVNGASLLTGSRGVMVMVVGGVIALVSLF